MHPAITLRSDDPAPLPPPAGPPEPDALAHLRRAHAAQVRRLEETLLSLDNLLAPQDWLDAGDGFPTPGGWRINRPAQRTQDRSHAPLAYLNEDEWRQHVALARDLCARNHLALGFRDHVANFVGPVAVSFVPRRTGEPAAGLGLGPSAFSHTRTHTHTPPHTRTTPAALLQACQQLWDEWCAFAEWGQGEEDREEECRRRLIVEGETTLRFFVGDADSDGLPHVRHVEPELIRTPPGSSTLDRHGWGVVTAPNDDEHEEGLWLCDPDDTSRGREVPVTEYVRVKANVDRTVKRGLSDFLPVGDHLRKVLGLLDNMAHVARVQAAIAWWEQYPSATLEQVATQVRLGADYQRPKVHPGSPGAATEVTGYEPGTVVRTEGGREVKPGPVSSGTAGFDAVQRMVLRGVGFRWGCPSYFSGDGDASFASVLVTGSPFVRLTQARQERVKAFACRVAARVLEFAERSGRLPAGTARLVRPVGTCRPVVIADEEKKARTFLALYQQNCADPMEFIRATGADPHQVAANIRAWKARFEDPPPGATGPGGPTPGGGPTPTPPGSAGGDGTSPNAPLGEWLLAQESNEADSHGSPMPTDDPGKGNMWKLSDIHHSNGTVSKGWRRVRQTDGSDADVTTNASELKAELANLSDDVSRLRVIALSDAKLDVKAEAAGWVLVGAGTKWQIGADASNPPVGNGHDLRLDDGQILRLPDVKTRESKSQVVLTDPEMLSKIAEVLQAHEQTTYPVVSGYIHMHHDKGTTFVGGFPPGETTYKPAPPPSPPPKKPKKNAGPVPPPDPPTFYTDLESWKTAVGDRLKHPDDVDTRFPALRLSPDLTTTFDKWSPSAVVSAREAYHKATEFLASPGVYERYKELISNQAVARVSEAARDALKAAGSDKEHVANAIATTLEPYTKNNPKLHEALTKVGELQDAFARNQETRDKVFASGTAQEVTGAVQKLTDQDKAAVAETALAGLTDDKSKAAVVSAGAKGLPDEAAKQLLAELQARFAAGGNPPANPPG